MSQNRHFPSALNFITATCLLFAAYGCEKTSECPLRYDAVSNPDVSYSDEPGQNDINPSQTCWTCLRPGMCFRFDDLKVTAPAIPEALPEFLNNIWIPDVQDYRLNIMFCLDSVTIEADGTMTLKVTAGAAWHDLPFEKVVPQGHSNTPSWFEFVEGFTTNFTAKVGPDCHFQTIGQADLWFHPGPKDHALVCSAGDPSIGLPVDTIPIQNLVAEATIDSTCSSIGNGKLTGCISREAACRICSFLFAPDYSKWSLDPNSSVSEKLCDSAYCEHNCGPTIWTNFAAFMDMIDTPMQCDTNADGTDDGYQLGGTWHAVKVTYKGQ